MRLINTSTVEVELFSNDDAVKYAILSHRWEDEEISLQDLSGGKAEQMKGYKKIQSACEEARRDNLKYVWIDTCCIDKTSSAELSEAINSMYRWYECAQICYAYLSDVDTMSDFEFSAWFGRGWTLQELVAPKHLSFYNKNWEFLGSKSILQVRISDITNIPLNVLRGDKPAVCSVAQRMSWAANRVTTRPEDKAYCLMGLFDVNMPMLYGEGAKAFIRLQEKIIKTSDDHSIFAWTMAAAPGWRGVLAPSPTCFRGLSKMTLTGTSVKPEQYTITNVGLFIRLPMMQWTMNTYLAVLQCSDKANKTDLMPHGQQRTQSLRMGIFLRPTTRNGQYVRVTYAGRDLLEVDTDKFAQSLRMSAILIL